MFTRRDQTAVFAQIRKCVHQELFLQAKEPVKRHIFGALKG